MFEHAIKNPFYASVMRDGIHIKPHRIIRPGVPVTNPYFERVQRAGGVRIRIGSGRPKKGEKADATETKSVRLPPVIWKRAEAQAESEGLSLHAAMRQAILIWLRS